MERVPNLLQKKENKPTESLPFVSIRVARLGNFQETFRHAICCKCYVTSLSSHVIRVDLSLVSLILEGIY
jgi:hypothetical protein